MCWPLGAGLDLLLDTYAGWEDISLCCKFRHQRSSETCTWPKVCKFHASWLLYFALALSLSHAPSPFCPLNILPPSLKWKLNSFVRLMSLSCGFKPCPTRILNWSVVLVGSLQGQTYTEIWCLFPYWLVLCEN